MFFANGHSFESQNLKRILGTRGILELDDDKIAIVINCSFIETILDFISTSKLITTASINHREPSTFIKLVIL